MARDYERDYREIATFAGDYIGKPAIECIDAYAEKRKIVSHRAGKVFWDKVDKGEIQIYTVDGRIYIKAIRG